MAYHLRFYPPANALAIYDTTSPATDNDPMFNPLDHAARVRFHSGNRYARFIRGLTVSGSATIPSQGRNTYFSGIIPLLTHSFGIEPVVFGKITSVSHAPLSGQFSYWAVPSGAMPWSGCVPVFAWQGAGGGFGLGHFAALCSTSTQVVMNYFGINPQGAYSGVTTINYRLYVLDSRVDIDSLAPDPIKPMLTFAGNRITAGRGIFDTNYRYLRQGAADQFDLVQGASMVIKGTPTNAPKSQYQGWGWRWSVHGVTVEGGQGSSSFAAIYDTLGI